MTLREKPSLNLRQKQSLFARLLPALIDHALALGFEVTLGEAWRSEWAATQYARKGLGIKASLHRDRLAIDLNLFLNGVYLSRSEAHQSLGEYWERQHSLCRWGGRFSRPDGNHYSLEHEGRQ